MARPLLCFIFCITFLSPYFCAAPAPPLLQLLNGSWFIQQQSRISPFLLFFHFPLLLEIEAGQ